MSSDILSQEEIDALVNGVDLGAVSTEAPPPARDEARQFDFATQDRIVRGRMPTLEMVNERFARLIRIGIFNLLRRAPEISVKSIEMVKFSDYLHSMFVPTNLNLIRVKPLRGTALIVFEPRLVFTAVDTFFGGGARFQTKIEGREFTATEMRVVNLLLNQVFADLTEAWQPVMHLEFEYINSEVNPHFANIVTPREYVVVSRFTIDFEGTAADIHIAMPYAMLEPMREILDAGIQSDRIERDDRWINTMRENIGQSELEVSSELTTARMSLRDLMNMKPGDVIPIEMPSAIDVCVENVPIFRGSMGVSNGRRAIKISDILRPSGALTVQRFP
jgi:flagellar motor switch protein FliM